MKTIEIKKEILALNGKPVLRETDVNWTIGSYLAEVILSYQTGGSMKKFLLATRLASKDKSIDIDEADLSIIKKALSEAKLFTTNISLNTLFNGQVELYLENIKEKK